VAENVLAPPRSSGCGTLPSISLPVDQMGFNFRAPGAARLEGTDVVTAVPVCNSRWIPEGRDRMSLFLVGFRSVACRRLLDGDSGEGVGTSTATFRDFPIGNNRLLLESVEGAWVGRYLNDLLWLLAAEPKELIECM
jgi:hypothetical protein